ncbi:DUF2924 domain-containing protein [Burkholderia diffusa]|uniref:DUF2924 domain-containing protein n=1 Tax=Burkholderia diffusa TaxID=488732 RepID=UPI00075C0773|nr:DUF2924 domain-containing protein [Burkholderia diffusa]KVG31424.1 hypothetical protein WJ30_14755 [Burkholderia diffusa]
MSTSPRAYTTPASVAAQIARLSDLPMAEIKALWRRLIGGDTPTHNRQFLERRIGYRLQEVEFRKVDPNLLERNKRRIANLIETGKLTKKARSYRPPAGTVLTREYQKVEYLVTVIADDRYEFEGRLYPSLSMIAREITGTRWSGPVFFGLTEPGKRKVEKQRGRK